MDEGRKRVVAIVARVSYSIPWDRDDSGYFRADEIVQQRETPS